MSNNDDDLAYLLFLLYDKDKRKNCTTRHSWFYFIILVIGLLYIFFG